MTDASETDFPLFQRKRELARAPRPPQLRDLPAAPTRSCHSRGAPPRPGRGGGRGGDRRLATCTFETKQTRPPRAQPRPRGGVGPLPGWDPRELGTPAPTKGPQANFLREGGWAGEPRPPCPDRPPPAHRSRDSNTPGLTHPQSHALGRRPLPRLAERRSLCSSDMICNFRQTFEVPDICIMWASLLATGNSCLAFPRLNCNYTRSLPGGGGGREGINTASWHFQTHLAFIHFLPPVKRPGIQAGPGCSTPVSTTVAEVADGSSPRSVGSRDGGERLGLRH